MSNDNFETDFSFVIDCAINLNFCSLFSEPGMRVGEDYQAVIPELASGLFPFNIR